MSRILSSKYFSHVDNKEIGGFQYQTIRSKFPGATMILVPNDDPSRPIACLSFIPNEALDSHSCDVTSALMPRDSVPQRFVPPYDTKGFNRYFQAMFNKGDREMAFVITNLVDGDDISDNDYVKIDILKSLPPALNQTDYEEHGVNSVNEIRPSQSFAVRSDRTCEYKTMVLKGVRNEQGAAMSVTQVDDALRRGETLKKEENYFFVTVTASRCLPEIANLLSNSTWLAADFFVRKLKAPQRLSFDRFSMSSNVRSLGQEETLEMDLDDDDFDDSADRVVTKGRQTATLSLSDDRRGGRGNDRDRGSSDRDRFDRSGFESASFNSSYQPKAVRSVHTFSAQSSSIQPFAQSLAVPRSSQPTAQSAWATGQDIGGSQAGRVSIGSRRIEQIGNQTNAAYIHTSPGEKLVLCFSVWHNMRVVPPIDQEVMMKESKLLIEDAQTTEQKILVKMLSKTFKSDDCCICFEPNPSMVILRCTHQCLCVNCCNQFVKKTCPVCRQQVTQTLDSQTLASVLK